MKRNYGKKILSMVLSLFLLFNASPILADEHEIQYSGFDCGFNPDDWNIDFSTANQAKILSYKGTPSDTLCLVGGYIFNDETEPRQLSMANWMVITIPSLVNNTKHIIISENYGMKFKIDSSNWNTESSLNQHNSFFAGLHKDGNPVIETADLRGLDTSNVTHMRNFFRKSVNLRELDVTGWDTSKVKSWTGTFAILESLETLDLSTLNTDAAIHMRWIFYGNTKLKNLNLDGWSTDKLINTSGFSTDPAGYFFKYTPELQFIDIRDLKFTHVNNPLEFVYEATNTEKYIVSNDSTILNYNYPSNRVIPFSKTSFNAGIGSFEDDLKVKETIHKVANTSIEYEAYVSQVQSMLDNPPILRGYDFTGWTPELPEDYVIEDTFGQNYVANYEEATYTINFETDGGGTIDPLYQKIDTFIVKPTDPEKEHHTFKGWYSDSEFTTKWDFDTDLVEDDMTLYAKYDVMDYPVHFIDHDGTTISTERIEYNKTVTRPSDPVRDHYDFDNWYTDETYTTVFDFSTKIDEETSIYAKYDVVEYPVHFIDHDGSTISTERIEYNKTVTRPSDPARDHYDFDNWYTDESFTTVFDFSTKIEEETSIYAKYDVVDYPVHFIDHDGTTISTERIEYNKTVTRPSDPVRDHYDFDNWYTDETFTTVFDFSTKIEEETSIYAKYDVVDYPVHFIDHDGTTISTERIEYNKTVTRPSDPARDHYDFDNWYTDETYTTVFDFSTKIDEETNIYAKYDVVDYPVHFIDHDGSIISTERIEYNKTVTRPSDPVRDHYDFDNWYTDETYTTVFDFSTKIDEETNIYAKYDVVDYPVHFIDYDGSTISTERIEYNKTVTRPSDPVRDHYDFDNWYTDETYTTIFDFSTKIDDETNIYAKYDVVEYPVHFIDHDGTTISTVKVEYDKVVTRPSDPTRDHYDFDNWYTDETYTTVFDFSTKIDDETNIYAKYDVVEYPVHFIDHDGTTISTVKVEYDKVVTRPSDPTRDHYDFDNWYTDETYTTVFDFSTKIDKETNIYAKYDKKTYPATLTIDGVESDFGSFGYGDLIPVPEDPSKEHYDFVGWYKDETLETKWDFENDRVEGRVNLYAKWSPKKYLVSFNDEGTVVSSERIPYNEFVSEFQLPHKPGYKFMGWYRDEAFSSAWNFLEDRVDGDVVLYAKWHKEDGSVVVDPETPDSNKSPNTGINNNVAYLNIILILSLISLFILRKKKYKH